MPPRLLPLLILPLLLAACTSNDIRISADWDPACDVATRKTFTLATGKDTGVITAGGHSLEIGTDLYRARVERSITAELLATGRDEVAPGKAQLRVVWGAQSQTVHESDTTPIRTWVSRDDPWRADYYETRYYHHEEQTLTIVLQNPASGATLWTGSVRAPEISDASPENREKRIRELVRRLFEKLPKLAVK